MLRGENLVHEYRRVRAVNDVTLSVERGEIVGLLGPNGAGKTTTFYLLVGLIAPRAGRVTLDGEDITELPLYLRARKGVGYLPQEPSVFRGLTVEENLYAVLEIRGVPPDEARARTDAMLEELGIADRRDRKATALSGGERRRLEIARALVLAPKVLLLDEPFAGVDPKQVADLKEVLRALRERHGVGVLITDHNVRETLDLVDRAYVIHQGRILCGGGAAELVDHPEVRRFYLGEGFRYEVKT